MDTPNIDTRLDEADATEAQPTEASPTDAPPTDAVEAVDAKPDSQDSVDAEDAADDDQPTELEKLAAQIVDMNNRYLRLQADFENFRRRTRQEREELSAVVTQGILADLLPIVDNLERALASDKDSATFHQGVAMIGKQLCAVLAAHGLEHIKAVGTAFDPNFHQAVATAANPELEDGIVAMELQKGYMVKGRVVRPSMVQVVNNG